MGRGKIKKYFITILISIERNKRGFTAFVALIQCWRKGKTENGHSEPQKHLLMNCKMSVTGQYTIIVIRDL